MLLLFAPLLLGYLLAHTGIIQSRHIDYVNKAIIVICLPALILAHLPDLKIQTQLLLAMGMPWLHFIFAFIFFSMLSHFIYIEKKTLGCLILVCGLGNTSFLGLPLIDYFFGSQGLPIGIVIDQGGSFLVLSTLGLSTAIIFSGGSLPFHEMIKRIILFPPFIAFLIALFLRNIHIPLSIHEFFRIVGGFLMPLALFSIGSRLNFKSFSKRLRDIGLGIVFKMILIPLVVWNLYQFFWDPNTLVFKVTVFESAMPPMVTASIIAMEQNLDGELASQLVGFGILFGILSLPLLHFIL